jgi:phosphoglycerate dehydrogenase-like enzyme
MGYGAIGAEVARGAIALGMRVLVIRQHPQNGSVSEKQNDVSSRARAHDNGARVEGRPLASIEVAGPDRLDEIIAQSDFFVLAAPLTEKTRHLINAGRLAHMRPGAYLINVSRGPLIDEAALADALRNRRLGGAALDVFEHEPLPADSPLWELDNLLITPHTAATSEKMWERHYTLINENLRRFLAGEPLLGLVDKRAGY